MNQFNSLINQKIIQHSKKITEDELFWMYQLSTPTMTKEYGAINSLDISLDSNDLLVTSFSKISLFDLNLNKRKTFGLNDTSKIYASNFRKSDYKLFTSSTDDGRINIFDINKKEPLRTIGLDEKTRHNGAVKKSIFFKSVNIVSFSDDKHIKQWDLAVGNLIKDIGFDKNNNQTIHSDYIRCGTVSDERNLIISGSYDHYVKLWDPRDNSCKPINKFDLGSQVESIIIKNCLIYSVTDKNLFVFDLIGGKFLKVLKNIHSKSITNLIDFDKYILTSSLDGHVKIFKHNFSLVHLLSYQSQLLSLCANKNGLFVGSSDGYVICRKFLKEPTNSILENKNKKFKSENVDLVVKLDSESFLVKKEKNRNLGLKKYDKFLKEFNYVDALNYLISTYQNHKTLIYLLQELIRRNGLKPALAGLNIVNLKELIVFITKNLKNSQYAATLKEVIDSLIEIFLPVIFNYEEIHYDFLNLIEVVNHEIKLLKNLYSIKSNLETIYNLCSTD